MWNITPCIPLKVYRRFGEDISPMLRVEERSELVICFMQVSILTYSSTLEVKAGCTGVCIMHLHTGVHIRDF
jgi:hypothetical protein